MSACDLTESGKMIAAQLEVRTCNRKAGQTGHAELVYARRPTTQSRQEAWTRVMKGGVVLSFGRDTRFVETVTHLLRLILALDLSAFFARRS